MKRLFLTEQESTEREYEKSESTVTIKSEQEKTEKRELGANLRTTMLTCLSDINEFIRTSERKITLREKILEDESSRKKQKKSDNMPEQQIQENRQKDEKGGEKKECQTRDRFQKKSFGIKSNEEKDKKFKLEKFIIDKNLLHGQKEVEVGHLKVYFPYEPYGVQIKYMENVIKALDSKSNALLESPTGTGKTICLLSSVLSWVQNQFVKDNTKTKVIYMSRTHSQLQQVHKELKKTCYRPTMAIFASRQQLCIKQELSQLKGREKVEACTRGVKLQRKLRKQQALGKEKDVNPKILQTACKYHKEREEVSWVAKRRLTNVLLDIPTMKTLGKQEQFCPYFYAHNAKNTATLFLMPYNYILDAYIFTSYADLLNDSIIIFDQAHNVAESACEGQSLTLQTSNIDSAISQLNGILSGNASRSLTEVRLSYQLEIKFIIKNLEDYKQNFTDFAGQHFRDKNNMFQRENWQKEEQVKIISQQKTDESLFYMFCGQVIEDSRRGEFNKKEDYYKERMNNRFLNPLKEIIEYGGIIIEAMKETYDGFCTNFEKFFIFANRINQLLLPKLYRTEKNSWLDSQIDHYRLYVQKNGLNPDHYTIGMKCLVPWLTFDQMKKCQPRSIILTSGTLKPLQMWQKQLRIQFPVQLVNNHVISKKQISSKIICSGPSQISLRFTFDYMSQNKDKIYKDLFETLIQICSAVPNGVLLVFPSFRLQNQFRIELNKSPKKYRLFQVKDVIFEEKSSDADLMSFKTKASSKKGALLAIICRGKLSEGIDFPDKMCRAVIIIGIPFPNIKDPFIIEKRNHLDYISKRIPNKSEVIRGQQWYFMGTIRSINQALGRVIRHASDYGMIFFIEKRYTESRFNKELPNWVTENMQSIDVSDNYLNKQINEFFWQMSIDYPESEHDHSSEQKEEKESNPLSFLRKPMGGDNQRPKNSFSILMQNRKKVENKKSNHLDFL